MARVEDEVHVTRHKSPIQEDASHQADPLQKTVPSCDPGTGPSGVGASPAAACGGRTASPAAGPGQAPGGTASERGTGGWYAVHTLPHQEMKAKFHLNAQQFEVFCPSIIKTVRHARKVRTIQAPLFPRYFFVSLDLERDRWRSVNGTFGVASLVMARDRPARVPPGLVEALMAQTDARGVTRLDHDLRVGDKVALLAGPMAGFVGDLVRLDGANRVRVLLQAMGGTIPLTLRSENLRRVS